MRRRTLVSGRRSYGRGGVAEARHGLGVLARWRLSRARNQSGRSAMARPCSPMTWAGPVMCGSSVCDGGAWIAASRSQSAVAVMLASEASAVGGNVGGMRSDEPSR